MVIDSFGKFVFTVLLKNKSAQTIKNSFENILISSERKPKCFGTYPGKGVSNNIFQNFLNNDNIKHYPRKSSLGVVFAERFNRTIRDFFKWVVFERADANWNDVLFVKTKQYITEFN